MVDLQNLKTLKYPMLKGVLDESDLPNNPWELFENWLSQAVEAQLYQSNSMSIATCGKDLKPSVRTVLLKQYDIINGTLTFFTDYKSPKSQNILENPNVEVLFYWSELERQIRFSGTAQKSDFKTSEDYFHSRTHNSQLGALASEQSQIIPSRESLEQKFKSLQNKYADLDPGLDSGLGSGSSIPLPKNRWGGFDIFIHQFEFWQGRESRLHDRFIYSKNHSENHSEKWSIYRISP